MISIDISIARKAWHDQQHVLKVSARVVPGSITKIYGPSGSGKTTLLKVIAGLITPDEGQITVNGQTWLDTQSGINLSPQKRKTGFVFQNYALFPNMTVQQHLEYASNDRPWMERLLKLGGLEAFKARKPGYLSGGQQQRLAILRAMAIKPDLLLMDEAFSALDQKMKTALMTDLKMLWDELDTTVLIVSHHPFELADFADAELYIGDQGAD